MICDPTECKKKELCKYYVKNTDEDSIITFDFSTFQPSGTYLTPEGEKSQFTVFCGDRAKYKFFEEADLTNRQWLNAIDDSTFIVELNKLKNEDITISWLNEKHNK